MSWLTFLGNMRRAVGKGAFFPGGATIQPAPAGTTEPHRQAALSTRLRTESSWLSISEHRVPITGLTTPLTVLHLTDLHIREQTPELATLCRRVQETRPDLVVLTGDVVTRGWREGAVHQLLAALPAAPLGRYAILGNWEHWSVSPISRWTRLLAAHQVTLLREEWRDLGPLVLAGTEDALTGSPSPDALLKSLPADRPAVVLTHSPVLFPALARPPVSLVLAGHSHGGQVRIPGLGAIWAPRGTDHYIAGWFVQDGVHLFVSRGIGWSVAPLRLHCPPELAWLQLQPGPPMSSEQPSPVDVRR